MKEFLQIIDNKKGVCFSIVVSIFYVLPLVIANYNYLDDTGRELYTYGWQHDGRFIATILGYLWSLGGNIFSLHPYTLILSAFILGVTGYILSKLLKIEEDYQYKISSLFLITSPFYLGNLVFKFDCLPMALSLFVIVFPFIFYHNKIKFYALSVLAIFLALGLYQTSATAYVIIVSIFLILKFGSQSYKDFFIHTILSASSFLLAYILYTIVLNIGEFDLSNKNEMIVTHENFIKLLQNNVGQFHEDILVLFNSGNSAYIYYSLFAISLLGCAFYLRKFSIKNIIPNILLIAICCQVAFYLIPSINILLKESYWAYRSFSGLPFFFLFCAFFISYAPKWGIQLGRVVFGLMVLFSFILMSQFGRMLTNQTEFNDYFVNEINRVRIENKITKISLLGKLPIAHRNYQTYQVFPIFDKLLSSEISGHDYFAKNYFNQYGLFDFEHKYIDSYDCSGELIVDHKYYNIIKVEDGYIIVDFNKTDCP